MYYIFERTVFTKNLFDITILEKIKNSSVRNKKKVLSVFIIHSFAVYESIHTNGNQNLNALY